MPKPIDPERWQQAKQAYVCGGESLEAIATQFGISKRAIEKKASEEGWAALRKAKAIPKPPTHSPTPSTKSFNPKPTRRAADIDELEIIELAINDVSTGLALAATEDLRSLGGCATGLCKLIELRRKLSPPTAAELADQVLALGIDPKEFALELKRLWEKA